MAGGFRELVEVFFWEFSWPGRGAAPMPGGIDFDRRDEDSGSLPHVAVMQSSDLRDCRDIGATLRPLDLSRFRLPELSRDFG